MRQLVHAVQRYYPWIFLACHVDHVRARSNPHRLSAKDASLLAHLDRQEPITAGGLARHSSVGAPALSAAVRRLEALRYLTRSRRASSRRVVELRLTQAGAKAMAAGSVLETRRVARLLARLTPAEARRAVEGLAALARAARSMPPGRVPGRGRRGGGGRR